MTVTACPEEREEEVAPARIHRGIATCARRIKHFEEWKGEASAAFIMVRENISEIVVANAMKWLMVKGDKEG